MIRAVLDTNVFVSAFLLPGRLNQLVPLILKKKFLWLLSQEIFEEYLEVAVRPLYHLSREELEAIFYQVKENGVWVDVHSRFDVISRDPADNKVLECAVDGRADWIVSGDRHLLALKTFRGIRTGLPAEFLRTIEG